MSVEENKAVIRRYFDEVWNQARLETLEAIMATDVIGHDATSHQPRVGFDSVQAVVLLFQAAFPGAQIPLYDILAESDRVAVRWGLVGVHRGDFMGVAPTGRAVDVAGLMIFRLENNKIVEYWGCFDLPGLLRQLNAGPTASE